MEDIQDSSLGRSPLVLLVDDEFDTLSLLPKIFRADGCDVDLASDGEVALSKFGEKQYDLILLDIILPHRDGLEVLRQIRKTDRDIGVIMISALTSERIVIDSMLAGADDYVSKPFQIREMRVRVRQVLDKVILRRANARLRAQLHCANLRIQELLERFVPVEARAEFMDCHLASNDEPIIHLPPATALTHE